jgi:hypothetical protein
MAGEGEPNDALLDYLLTNTPPGTYLVAVERANDAAPFILATGRPALTFSGFLGQYDEVTVEQLSMLVNSGLLRYVLLGQDAQRHPEITAWVRQNCAPVSVPGASTGGSQLYLCGPA